ncbi:MAG TPA: glucose-6-phosphate dehydrogenase, partial [Burkholderiaceae bacterium]|nr:glucose-6-phosphate dehydrogenase [Burkholderiaceae bacterium]
MQSDALVLFGVTGDLAFKKVFPSLFAMAANGRLRVPVVGVAREGLSREHLIERARESLQAQGKPVDESRFARLADLLRYVPGNYEDPATYRRLRSELGDARHPVHYLAIPPSMFGAVVDGLAASGCAAGARVVLEKPFGRSLASARALSATLHRAFDEESILRIDHYLGKETVRNLL